MPRVDGDDKASPAAQAMLSWQTHPPVSQGATPAILQRTASLAAGGTVNNPFELLPPVLKCDQYAMTPATQPEPSPTSETNPATPMVTEKGRDVGDAQKNTPLHTDPGTERWSHSQGTGQCCAQVTYSPGEARGTYTPTLPQLMWQTWLLALLPCHITQPDVALSPKSPDSQRPATSEIQTGQLFILLISAKSCGEGALQDLPDSGLGASAPRLPQEDRGYVVAEGHSTESCDEAGFTPHW